MTSRAGGSAEYAAAVVHSCSHLPQGLIHDPVASACIYSQRTEPKIASVEANQNEDHFGLLCGLRIGWRANPPDVRPHRLGVVVNAQRVCRRVVDDIGLFAVVPVSKGEAQTSASWLSAGSFQRQIMLQAAQIHVIYDSTRSGQPRPIGRLGRPGRQHWPLTSTWSRTARPSSRPSRSWSFRRL